MDYKLKKIVKVCTRFKIRELDYCSSKNWKDQTLPVLSNENLGRAHIFPILPTTILYSDLQSCANPNNFFGLLIYDLQQGRRYKNRPVHCKPILSLSWQSHVIASSWQFKIAVIDMHMTGNQLTGRYVLWNSVKIVGDNSNFNFFMALTVNSNFPPPVSKTFCKKL